MRSPVALCLAAFGLLEPAAASTTPKNVLLIIADDMRPNLRDTYNQPWMSTPNLDALAKESLVFDAAFANFAICCASKSHQPSSCAHPSSIAGVLSGRNSFLSGRMPDSTRTWNFENDFRRDGITRLPGGQLSYGTDWVSLPEFFHTQGYYTASHGKVFHNNRPRKKELKGLDEFTKLFKTSCPDDLLFCPGSEGTNKKAYSDYKTASKAIKAIKKRSKTDQPWFVALGLHFPHITWAVPDWCVDAYDFQQVLAATNRSAPIDCPDVAFTAEFDGLTHLTLDSAQINEVGEGTVTWPVPTRHTNEVPEAVDRFLRLGYYASITHSDWLIGKTLNAAKSVKDNTLVIFTSDHGFSLGEQGEWGKHTLFDNSLRIPLIVRAPWIPGCVGRTAAFFELIDLYRTMVSLAGLDTSLIEPDVDGVDQAPIFLNDTVLTLRDGTYAQYSRCPQSGHPAWYLNNCEEVTASQITVMGYSVRENDVRFTEWYSFSNCVANFNDIIATEVYVQQDPRMITAGEANIDFDNFGNVNIAEDLDADEIDRLRSLVRDRFDTGENFGCP